MRSPSPALVVSCVALAVALGGTGYALTTLPKNSVGTAQIKKDAVTGAKIKAGSVEASDLKAGVLAKAAGTRGETGPRGETGATGATGPSGVTASAAASTTVAVSNLPASAVPVVALGAAQQTANRRSTGAITVSAASRLMISASAVVRQSSGSGGVATCSIRVDGTPVGVVNSNYGESGAVTLGALGDYATVSLSAMAPVAAGTHDVELACVHVLISGGTTDFVQGTIWAVATAA